MSVAQTPDYTPQQSLVRRFAAAYEAHLNRLGNAPRFARGWDRRIAADTALAID